VNSTRMQLLTKVEIDGYTRLAQEFKRIKIVLANMAVQFDT